ncbi:MAG: FHA domain-containing protein [Elusimicrobia bacterium]|nr:FHA domain-containing protein [Elusimicrobiota bacterium]
MAKLLLKFNAQLLKEIPLDQDILSVGRKPDNNVVIDHPAVSSHHCRIVRRADGFVLEDLDSTNGTYVNDKRVLKVALRDNDVIGLARHALVFVEDKRPAAVQEKRPAAVGEETLSLTPKEAGQAPKAAAPAPEPAPAPKFDKIGGLRVLKGIVGEVEYELKGLSTYIGKSDRVQIPIKGAGLFGAAPEVAASIHHKPEGFLLVAVSDGYPVVNGTKVRGQILLNDGDLIECGGTMLQFFLRDA